MSARRLTLRLPMDMSFHRVAVATVLLMGCQHRVSAWESLASQSGCTPRLLSRTSVYDSSSVLSLAGSYRLVQIDTARGWVELFLSRSSAIVWPRLRLTASDSAHAHGTVN